MHRKKNQLVQTIFVIQKLVERDRKKGSNSTFMGELWEIINPLINMIVMVLVFGKMFGNNEDKLFPVYVLVGTTFYGLFNSGTMLCIGALAGNKTLLITTHINKNVFVLERVLFAFTNFIYSMIVLAGIVALYHIKIRIEILFVIFDIFLLLLLVLGIGKILAVINVTFADITYLYKIVLLVFMYGSSIFYRVERLAPVVQNVMNSNPIFISIEIARDAIMYGKISSFRYWITLFLFAVICYALGTWIYEKGTEDVVAKL